ncbi:hypothetical protein MHU86_7569 [Fragilaria crotonensis]|nr:hypothetical protein MHU86_7569 [Fragilaria crotonensis]
MELKRTLKKKKKIDEPTCFPGDAMVTVEGKGQIEMRHIEIGDHVLGMNGKYTPVYAFAYQADHITSKFVRILTNATATGATSAPLQLSAQHLLFLHEHQEFPVLPSDLKKGDVLLGAANMEPLEIVKIEHNVMAQGVFAPLTADGTIAVNGIVASNYAFLLMSHKDDPSDYIYYNFGLWGNQKKQFKVMTQNGYMHMLCSPLRIAAFGISPWFGTPANDEGTNYFVGAFFQAHMWRLAQPHATTATAAVVSAFGIFIASVMSGIALVCYAVECLVGPSMTPVVIGLVAMMALTLVVNQRKEKKTQIKLNGSGMKFKAA